MEHQALGKSTLLHLIGGVDRPTSGKNANPNSIGIGLALAKTIIEKDNGSVSVNSDDTGTEFLIKYYLT